MRHLAYVRQREHGIADVEVADGTRQAQAARPQAQRAHAQRRALAVRVLLRGAGPCAATGDRSVWSGSRLGTTNS